MATWSHLHFQDANSPLMEQLIYFHDYSMIILIMIMVFISYIMTSMLINKMSHRLLLQEQTTEMIWSIIPAITLIFIALPSLRLLYLLDENFNPSITIKAIGHQWYWTYQYSDFNNTEFDSYMIPSTNLSNKDFRLISVDNRTILPYQTQIRALISASDVIHSWTIPSLGIKVDAIPGRLSQTNFYINRPGLFFGQCSEICGTNHSFMPIVIESVPMNYFLKWIKKYNM